MPEQFNIYFKFTDILIRKQDIFIKNIKYWESVFRKMDKTVINRSILSTLDRFYILKH